MLLCSLSNSFSEEVIDHLGVVVPLVGTIDTSYVLLVSAIAFGMPHFRGMPNAIVGTSMAGMLGWVLAKSVVETNGIFWRGSSTSCKMSLSSPPSFWQRLTSR